MTGCDGCSFELGNLGEGFKKLCLEGKTQEVKDRLKKQNTTNAPYETGNMMGVANLKRIESFARLYHYKGMLVVNCNSQRVEARLYRNEPNFSPTSVATA
tara:strand:+ start:1089 stop:1388 length:300 start_codon:yes stop_codon:yes gene_type:complete